MKLLPSKQIEKRAKELVECYEKKLSWRERKDPFWKNMLNRAKIVAIKEYLDKEVE